MNKNLFKCPFDKEVSFILKVTETVSIHNYYDKIVTLENEKDLKPIYQTIKTEIKSEEKFFEN
jgi:hypothetical protein